MPLRTLSDEVWRGAIPVCFRLGGDAAAPPLYVMVPRLACLGAFEARLRRHWSRHDDAADDDDGDEDRATVTAPSSLADSQYFARPLASPTAGDSESDDGAGDDGAAAAALWFRDPIGGAPLAWGLPAGVAFDAAGAGAALPWAVDVVFGAAPDEAAGVARGAAFAAFFHALKQAVHLERGTARLALALPRVDQEALFAAATSGDRAAYAARDVAPPDAPRRVPVRLLVAGRPVVQLPFAPGGDLADALRAPVAAAFGDAPATAVAHGVALPWDLPLLDAWCHLKAADHFLYLVLRPAAR